MGIDRATLFEQNLAVAAFLARTHDLVLFVCGKKSSNGKVLYEECRSVNANTHLVSDIDELNPAWLEGKSNIGICGATSTPRWLMAEFQARIEEILQ